ncbi:MAG TPA: glycosyltransferase family A protein [Anaerolineaceae bacterium]|nr:glycosyltransferase family A protein [Anaerolineaceae bacterium]
MSERIDVLIPTYNRPDALAVTLTSLINQTDQNFRVIISDQTPERSIGEARLVSTTMKVLAYQGHSVELHRHIPSIGMAEQRNFLLEQSSAPYVLFLDDDLILESRVIENLRATIEKEQCGFVGCAVIGLSYLDDIRPEEQAIELWNGPVEPEEVLPDTPAWERYKLHNAANLAHVQNRLGLTIQHPRPYKVAWVGGCVLYHAEKLRSVGGFSFWQELPPQHSGEDVLAQLRVMRKFGGCGLIPSGVYHQELPTQVPVRDVDAPRVLSIAPFTEAH